MNKKYILAIALGAVVFMIGCNGPGLKSNSNKPAATVNEAINEFDTTDIDQSFKAIDYYLTQPESHRKVADSVSQLFDSEDTRTRFLAVYTLINSGNESDSSTLLPILLDSDEATKVLAAGTLIGWGEKDAIPVLIESLSSDTTIPYSDPIKPLRDLAIDALPYYTGQDFGLSSEPNGTSIQEIQEQWEKWWNDAGESLTWNSNANTYE